MFDHVHALFADDVIYNQSMPGNAMTMGKQRPDLHDELGYIAPPNRKLPPVPGSNYNTCDRIKRGTNISKVIAGGPRFSHTFISSCLLSFPLAAGCCYLFSVPDRPSSMVDLDLDLYVLIRQKVVLFCFLLGIFQTLNL